MFAVKLFLRQGPRRFPADWVVAGLGNPGEHYARHRHNVGFWVVNELARRAHVQPKAVGRTLAIAVGEIGGAQVALVKPRTYVNESGAAVRQALAFSGCDVEHTIVAYDELDLPPGALRIRKGGGTGGHNGLKSIAAAAGSEFVRVRIGIGRPMHGGEPSWDPEVVANWVLSAPEGDDVALLEATVRAAADAVEAVLVDGVDAAANRFNRR